MNKPATIGDLKAAITREARRVPVAMIRRVFESFTNRLSVVKARDGKHMEHVIGHSHH